MRGWNTLGDEIRTSVVCNKNPTFKGEKNRMKNRVSFHELQTNDCNMTMTIIFQ